MAKLTATVVGGGSGGRLSLTGLAASAEYTLKAVADLRPETGAELEKLYPGLRAFTSHEQMFRECPADVVCVSTWPPSHEAVTRAALQGPLKGILVEKPLGDTAAAGASILAQVKARGIPMAVPHGLLVTRHTGEIFKRVQGGEIGDVLLVEVQCRGWDILNAGIHWVNFFVQLVKNEPVDWVLAQCDASTRTFRDGLQVETMAVTYAQTKSGVRLVMNTGDYAVTTRAGKGTVFHILGTQGSIEFWAWESAYRIVSPAFPTGKHIDVTPHPQTNHQMHLENLARQIAAGTPDYAVAESSQTALEICEAAFVSSRERCQVTLPLAGFKAPPQNDWRPGTPYSGSGGGRDGRKLR